MAGDAKLTAMQENGSKVFFEQVVENRVSDYNKLSAVVKKVYPSVDSSWMESYAKQATALVKFLNGSKGYVYSRDEANGFMVFIETIAKSKCGVTNKDRWNPADIYMVKRNKEGIIKEKIKDITSGPDKETNLRALNSYMREMLAEKSMVPVSLKAIKPSTPSAKADLANMGGNKEEHTFKLKPNSVKCNLSMGHKVDFEFDTGEFAFDFYVGEEEIHGQSRNFQYSQARNLVQTDLTPKGRSGGAKLGKVSSEALDSFLRANGLERPASAAKDPNIDPVGKWTQNNINYWVQFQKSLSTQRVGGSAIDFGDMTVKTGSGELKGMEEVMKNAILWEEKTRSAAGRFSSKLIGLRWCKVWVEIDRKGKLDEWLKTLYYGAKKEFGDLNGPFLKIY